MARYYINGSISHYDNEPDDGYTYVFDSTYDAFRRVQETTPALAASGWIDFSDVAADGEVITINGRVYECNTTSTPSGTADVNIDLTAASTVDQQIAAIAAAINADTAAVVTAAADTAADSVFLYAVNAGTAGNAITLTTDIANATASAATLTNGQNVLNGQILPIKWTITAAEATAGIIRILTPFTTVRSIQTTFSDAGVLKTADVTATITEAANASVIKLAEGSAPAFAANDVLYVTVFGTL